MGVSAPIGVTKAYYFAYPIGLALSFGVYWVANWISPPPLRFPLSEWHEPKDYIRPEERDQILDGGMEDVESVSISGGSGEKGLGEKAIHVRPTDL